MPDIAWEDYLGLPPATVVQVEKVERQLGIRFPEDFRRVLIAHQGQNPVPASLSTERLHPVNLGPVYHVLDTPNDFATYAILNAANTWRPHYPGVVPVIDSGGGNCVAYDFTTKEPTLVFIHHEADPSDPEALIPVARSFADLLNQLRPEKSRGSD